MSRDFYQLCYEQYKQEMLEADGLYQKAGVMLVVLPLLGAAEGALGRLDILKLCFTRVDVFFFYAASLATVLALAISTALLFFCICPRRYKTLASMDVWHKWREDYQGYLNKTDRNGDVKAPALDDAMVMSLCNRLTEAQPANAEINETRRKAFGRSVKTAAIALAAVGVQALFYVILKLQGV